MPHLREIVSRDGFYFRMGGRLRATDDGSYCGAQTIAMLSGIMT